MNSVYCYIRVSTDHQAESGLGLDDQTEVVTSHRAALVKRLGLSEGMVFSDPGVSATKCDLRDRPGGRKLDDFLRRGDHVVIAKLDRAFRNQADCCLTLAEWDKKGVLVHLLDLGVDTSTPSGKLVVGIMAAFAEWEAARIGERIRGAKKAQRRRGRSTNGARRLGYTVDDDGNLTEFPEERKLGEWCRKQALRKSYRSIIKEMQAAGQARPMSELPWTPQAVGRLIKACKQNWP